MSKLQRLRDNIAAIECALKGENNSEVLSKYTGFGGLGFILKSRGHKEAWNKSDLQYYDDTVRLFMLLHEHTKDVKEFLRWEQSLKNSVMTAFYTPKEIVRAIEKAFADFDFDYMLDPASGNGVFMRLGGSSKKAVAYEKDLLTGLLLKSGMYGHWENVEVRVDGFENFPKGELGLYDLVSTNVPFGDIPVYDAAFEKSGNPTRVAAQKMVHRYYVLKGLDCLREGGLLAYIITSNYLNNDTEQVQEALKQSRLIGVYRLANNLFAENGTTVGTDLLVLQKDSKRGELTENEKLLLTQCTEEGCPNNYYFVEKYDHIMATGKRYDTDAYGKPGITYLHDGGVKGIAEMLGKALAIDMKAHCDAGLFEGHAGDSPSVNATLSQQGQSPCVPAGGKKKAAKQEALLTEVYQAYVELEKYERENQT